MTIAQKEKFYEQDKNKYNISQNKNLLIWLDEIIKKGYHPCIDIETLQKLIDNIASWYEIKYPEREFEFYDGEKSLSFKNINPLSKLMTIEQLMFRLPNIQLELLKCNYHAYHNVSYPVYNDENEIIGFKSDIGITIKRKNIKQNDPNTVPYFILLADSSNGNIDEKVSTTLNQLLVSFRKHAIDNWNFSELEECVYDHNCDIQLRKMILQLVALKLLYSNNTTPERGYERAKRFINEFNKKLNLNLDTVEIDESISRIYSYDENQEVIETNYANNSDSDKKRKSLKKSKSCIK